MSRFDYVKYDSQSAVNQLEAKSACEYLERIIEKSCRGRAKQLALTKLEECYMWIGKAIRDEQLSRDNETELQEERNNS